MGSRRTHEEAAVAAARAAYIAGFADHVEPRGGPPVRDPDGGHGRARVHPAARRRTGGVHGPDRRAGQGHDAARRHLRRADGGRARGRARRARARWRCGSTRATCSSRRARCAPSSTGSAPRDTQIVVTSDLDEYAIAALAAAPVDALRRGHVARHRLRRTDRGHGLQAGRPRRTTTGDDGRRRQEEQGQGLGRPAASTRCGGATPAGIAEAEVLGVGQPPVDDGDDRALLVPLMARRRGRRPRRPTWKPRGRGTRPRAPSSPPRPGSCSGASPRSRRPTSTTRVTAAGSSVAP